MSEMEATTCKGRTALPSEAQVRREEANATSQEASVSCLCFLCIPMKAPSCAGGHGLRGRGMLFPNRETQALQKCWAQRAARANCPVFVPAYSWGPTPSSGLHLLSGSAGTTVQLMGSEMTQKHNGHKRQTVQRAAPFRSAQEQRLGQETFWPGLACPTQAAARA